MGGWRIATCCFVFNKIYTKSHPSGGGNSGGGGNWGFPTGERK